MSADDIQRVLPDAKPDATKTTLKSRSGATLVSALAIENLAISPTASFPVHFLMDASGKLAGVTVLKKSEPPSQDVFAELEAFLTRVHGPPAKPRTTKGNEIGVSWKTPEHEIRLNYSPAPNASSSFIVCTDTPPDPPKPVSTVSPTPSK